VDLLDFYKVEDVARASETSVVKWSYAVLKLVSLLKTSHLHRYSWN